MLFIAKRILTDNSEDGRRFSRPAVRIAQLGIIVGLAVMIVSLAVVMGFKREVSSKVIGFGSHIQVLSLTQTTEYEMLPILTNDSLMKVVKRQRGLDHMQRFVNKTGMLKTDDSFRGVQFKGVGEDYDMEFFRKSLVDGEIPKFSSEESTNSILISRKIATDLGLSVSDRVYAYFVDINNKGMRARKFTVAGIYETNLTDYDRNMVFTDIVTMRKLCGWTDEMSSGLEITVKNFDEVEDITNRMSQRMHGPTDRNGVTYGVFSVRELAAHTFAWLDVLDTNVVMILILMMLVSAFTVVSGLMIVMLERIQMIGVLRALGATNMQVRRVFIYFAIFLVGGSIIMGDVVGLGICYAQEYFHLVQLDASVYYLDTVPIHIEWLYILLINVATIIISSVVIFGSSFLVNLGAPAKALRWE